jgi:hypothetical protein
MDIFLGRSRLQNRVDPWGRLHVSPERGAWMGNRGILHDERKEVVRLWQHTGWVTCRVEYGESSRKGETARDKLFTPGNYSELFFLDEATAFSAGHRPCAQCRNKRYKEFKRAWTAANRERVSSDDPSFKEMDKVLQGERVDGREKKSYQAVLDSLPDGTMIEINSRAYLVWRRSMYLWSFPGYVEEKGRHAPSTTVTVLTPESIVRIFAQGFVPQVHVSAFW